MVLGAAATLCRPALAGAKPVVLVVGGGPGGVAAARALAASGAVAVTLIERQRTYCPPWTFNAVLGGLAGPEAYDYASVARAGIGVRQEAAVAVDPDRRRLHLAGGDALAWDRLVLAPGVAMRGDWDSSGSGLQAWTSEGGIEELEAGLARVPDGGGIVLVTPGLPMRCPPAPYERASMMAARLLATGRGGARITVLDGKESGGLLGLFQAGWEANQPGMVDWLPPSIHGGIEHVEARRVVTGFGAFEADLVCAIPGHGAGRIAQPFTDASGWCAVEPLTMRVPGQPHIHVAGDAAALPPVPKSAVAAASSGQAAAAAVLADLGVPVERREGLDNLCWGRLAPGRAVRSADQFQVDAGGIRQVAGAVSSGSEPPEVQARTFEAARRWQQEFRSALFG